MVNMKMNKGGFTLIEVSLFLAITGLLFLGVTIGVQNSIFQQRYNDSVQSFVEFLRTAYSKVENVQGYAGGSSGQSNRALYGKLITFGEHFNLSGGENTDGAVFIYDVIGDAKCDTGGLKNALDSLYYCNANVQNNDSELLGLADSYTPRWSAAIQSTNINPAGLFVGAILITRHPQTGTINTFVHDGNNGGGTIEINSNSGVIRQSFREKLGEENYFSSNSDVDFCINPNGDQQSNVGSRKDVRIKARARNASAIEITTDSDNRCMENN